TLVSLKAAGARIRAGTSIVLFPEGTRSGDGRLLPFKKGAFALAEAAGVPLVPVTIHGSGLLMPRRGWQIHPGQLRVRVGVPFHGELTQNSDFLHGAILFQVADTAGFVASNSLEETYSVLTVDYHVNFVRPVQHEGVFAIAEVTHQGKTLMVTRSQVFAD